MIIPATDVSITAAVANANPAGALISLWNRNWAPNLLQWIGVTSDPALIGMTPPVRQQAPAPQTAGKMDNWTPADAQEATAQKQQQYESDLSAWRAIVGLGPAGRNSISPVPDPTRSNNTLLYAALGVGAFSLLMLMRKK